MAFLPSTRARAAARRLAALSLGLSACAPVEPPPPRPAPPPPLAPTASAAPGAQAFVEDEITYVFADPDRRKKIEATLPAIDALCEAELRDEKLPGLVAGLVVDGELVYAKGFGFADVEKKTRPDADTVYRIASNTKSFIALAVLALRDEGALSLDDPLTRLIPEASGLVYPTHDTPPITLRQLLDHTAGLPRDGSFEGALYEREVTEEEITRSLSGLALERPPGTAFSYSNLGYRLLSLAVSRATHVPMPAFMKQHLLDPLGMTATTFEVDQVPAARLAPPYVGGTSDPFHVAPTWRHGTFVGAGGLYSSLRDMGRYLAFEMAAYPPRSAPDAGPVRRSSVRASHFDAIVGQATGAYRFNYGYGWFVEEDCALGRLVTHSGAVDGYGAWWGFLPESGVGFIESTNVHRGGGLGKKVLGALAKAGALTKRVSRAKRLSRGFEAVMPRFLAVQNAWDEATYQAIFNRPASGRRAAVKEELAGYRAAHGVCKGYTPLEISTPTEARFELQCERGKLEMSISLSTGDPRIDGFVGTSRDVAPPPALQAAADRITALIGHWDERAYKKHLAPRAKEPPGDTQATFAQLGRAHGACKVKSFYPWANRPRFALGCERGGDLDLWVTLDEQRPDVVATYAIVDDGAGACAAR